LPLRGKWFVLVNAALSLIKMRNAKFYRWFVVAIFTMLASVAAQAVGQNHLDKDFGLADIRGKQACISTQPIASTEGKKITLVITAKEQKVVTGVIEREARNECDHLEKADLPRPYYLARLDNGDANDNRLGVAILKPLKFQSMRGKIIGRDERKGVSYTFSECTGEESVHLFSWRQDGKRLKPIWHAYYYLPYAVEPSCGDRELKAMKMLNLSLNPDAQQKNSRSAAGAGRLLARRNAE
jgi:hypothetical protein